MLGREDFQGSYTGAETSGKENHCRQSRKKLRIQINQQAKTNQHKSRDEYAPGDFAGCLRDYVAVKLKRHLKSPYKATRRVFQARLVVSVF
jgi:hypothetical protein